jgi:murein DD-endopeptidase MepM/ murein hydrolase activator NlpD
MRFAALLLLALLLQGCAHSGPINPATPGQGSATVQQGENLYDVARRLNVTPRDLIEVNHLAPPYQVKTGQVLTIPAARVYTVVKGDSLSLIAQKFDVGMSRIAELNHLSPPFKIFPGQQLQISGGASGQAAVPPPVPAETEAAPAAPKSSVEAVPLSDARSTPPPAASATALAPPVASTPTANGGKGFAWPVQGQIISGFGMQPDGLQNDGINIAAPAGTPVKSTAAGTVAYAGNELKGFGNLILVKHPGGWVSAYAHLDTVAVKKGDAVKSGQVLGTVGQTGAVDSPQLHFELRQGKEAIDPATQLR